MNEKQRNAMHAIDDMLKNLHKPKIIKTKEIRQFYASLEEHYDEKIEEIEEVLYQNISDEEKFERLKKISNLLEINIF